MATAWMTSQHEEQTMTTDEMIKAMFEEGVRHGIWERIFDKEAWRLTELGKRLSQDEAEAFSINDNNRREAMSKFDMICVEIGARGRLSHKNAKKAAEAWKEARRLNPRAIFTFAINGYDEDPRAI
jgi:hypothetical protein